MSTEAALIQLVL